MITVELPGLTLTNEPHQTVPYLVDLEGWFDGVDLGLDVEARSNADGTFDQSQVFKGGRFPAVSGALLTLNDSDALWELNDTLMSLYSLGAFDLAVTDPRGRRLTATVRLGGKITFPIDDEDGQGSFVVPLWAKDPVKYDRRSPVSTGLPAPGGGMVFPAPGGVGAVTRRNLLPNPSFETGTTGWTGVLASLGQSSSTAAVAGSYRLYITVNAVGAEPGAASDPITVTPGLSYTVSAYNASMGTALTGHRVGIVFLDGSGARIGTPIWGAIAGIGLRGSATVTAPAGAVSAKVLLAGPDNAAVGYDLQFDAVLLEQSATLGAYIDDVQLDGAGLFDFGANGTLGRVTLSNNGKAAISPHLTIAGGLEDGTFISCLETAEVLRYDRVIPPGSTVMIDCLTGEVILDGQSDGSQYLTVADYFTVPPGETRTLQFNAISSGDASALLTVSDADGHW